MLEEILVVGAIVLVTALGVLFTMLSFVRLPESNGIFVHDRHKPS